LTVSRDLGYYSGVEDGESWSEGSRTTSIRLPTVPAGQYYLRIDPESPAATRYAISVRRDVPMVVPYGIVFLLLLVPPILMTIRPMNFEYKRWQESDYAS
jgi:hypothetical protein